MMEDESNSSNTGLFVDRINDLPDSILCIILSFLPSNEVLASSVLSKRWEFLWVTVMKGPNLDFSLTVEPEYDFEDDFEVENMQFVKFVNHVFLLNDGENLNSFRLVWYPCIPSHVTLWIDTAITRNVCKIFLDLHTTYREFNMPINAFTCVSLKSLKLIETNLYVSDALVVDLPRLEILVLDLVCFQSEEAVENLISGCSMLRSLYMNVNFAALGSFSCKISSTSLRSLEISFEYKCCLKLKAPSLEYLIVDGVLFVEESLTSLVKVDFHATFEGEYLSSKAIVEAVCAFDRAKDIYLSSHVMRALSDYRLSTTFERLVILEIAFNDLCCSSLHDLLQCSTKLEVLVIHHDSAEDKAVQLIGPVWIAPLEVPVCLSFSLKKVQLIGYRGSQVELKMIQHLLMNGRALELMQVSYDLRCDGERSEFLRQICEFPKESPTCEVHFSVWPSRKFRPLHG